MENGLACESLEAMPRRQAEEASPPIPAPPAGAGASGRKGDIPSPGCLSQCLSCLWLLQGWHLSQPPNRVNIHEQQSRPQPAGALQRLQNVTVRSAPEWHFPHSSGATRPIWPWPCVNRLLCRTWMWPLGTTGAGVWSPETMAVQARSQAAGLVLKESALLAEAGVQAVVGTITVHGSLQGRGLSFFSHHTAPFQNVKFCGLYYVHRAGQARSGSRTFHPLPQLLPASSNR